VRLDPAALYSPLPPIAGIGLRGPHLAQLSEGRAPVGWIEVHAENYMNFGPATAALMHARSHYPLAVHGVGLSLGSAGGIDETHLARLKTTCERLEPVVVSEHLAWCVGDGVYLNDLLPVPFDEEALNIVCRNIERTQEAIGRRILIENLSTYVGFARSTMTEPEFLTDIAKRTGCGLLLDINNVYVSAHNMGFDAEAYIAGLPADAIGEFHLAGHASKESADGWVLIDDHGSSVASDVWSLYRFAVRRFGPRPTLVEWDTDIPPLATLLNEAGWADRLLKAPGDETEAAEVPQSRAASAQVSVCEHHPLAKSAKGTVVHA
jgi:uncharacterized protein (UPF0276 family)